MRSIERRKIFRDDKDRIDFVQRFGLILEKAHVSDSNFVSEIMEKAEENVQKKYMLKSQGIDLDYIAIRVSSLMKIPEKELFSPGRYRKLVKARSLLWYWALRELGVTMTAMAEWLNISTAEVSKAVFRGSEIVKNSGYALIKLKS